VINLCLDQCGSTAARSVGLGASVHENALYTGLKSAYERRNADFSVLIADRI